MKVTDTEPYYIRAVPATKEDFRQRHHCIHTLINHVYTKDIECIVIYCPTTVGKGGGVISPNWSFRGEGVCYLAPWVGEGHAGLLPIWPGGRGSPSYLLEEEQRVMEGRSPTYLAQGH